jgi:acetoacetyl-CoA synthetase
MTQIDGTEKAEVLWRHPNPTSTPMWRFLQSVKDKHELDRDNYQSLYKWSVENVSAFWEECWDFVGIVSEKGHEKVSFSER